MDIASDDPGASRTVLSGLKRGDHCVVTLKDGRVIEGWFYRFEAGLLTLQAGTSIRDIEMTDLRSIEVRPDRSRLLKPWVFVLAGVAMAFIIFSFVETQ